MFLGRTFRGEIGQFFTPRTIVEFMVRMVDPKEGEIICDPASGSGGFLIRFLRSSASRFSPTPTAST
jgi:type I restriction enzyme M protein